MKSYTSRMFEDPLDGPFPTRQSKWTSNNKRKALKRKMRHLKKGVRQKDKRIQHEYDEKNF